MNYTDVTQVFDLLESTDGLIQITPVHLSGFVSRTSTINSDGDIAPGAVNTADIQFSVLDIRGPVSSYTGREFVYRKGYAEAATREKMSTAADAYVTRGGVEYYVYGTTLTATDGVTTNTYTVTKGAGALVLRGAELMVLYPDEPYAQRFTVDGTTLTDIGAPLFVYDYDRDIAARYARQRVSYVVADDNVTAYHAFKMFNVRYLDTTVYEVHTVGYFTFDRPKRGTGGVYTVSASDRMTAFDSDYIDVLNGATKGTTAQQLLESLCSAAGVELSQQDRYNANLVIVTPEDLESCTGAQILTWLGELMGCSWRINSSGQLESVWFAQTSTRLTRDDYVSFSYEAFMVEPIDKVMTGSAYADVVGFAGPGANTLVIDNNSLLSYTEQDDLNSFSSGLLTKVATVPEYRPGTLSGYANPTISPGDVIYVDNDDDEIEPVCVTQVTESGFQLTVTSSGNPRREVQNYASASLQTIKRTVEQLREQTGAFPDQWAQDIENTVNAITGAMGGTRVDLFNPDTGLPSGTAYCLDGDGLDTAKKVLVINAGGIAFYNDGFDAENPEASVPAYVVMNNQGQVDASSILTGILTAVLIRSADGSSYWDLTGGNISMVGTFKSNNGVTGVGRNEAVISSGSVRLDRVPSSGKNLTAIDLYGFGGNAAHGALSVNGTDQSGSNNTGQFIVNGTYTGANVWIRDAAGNNKITLFGGSDGNAGFTGNVDVQGGTGLGVTNRVSCRALSCWDSSQKSGIVQTSFGNLKMIAFETPEPTFADSGSGVCGPDGTCFLDLDPRFAETLSRYAVPRWQVTPTSPGSVWVETREADAIVHGEPGMTFDWMCMGPQTGISSLYAEPTDADPPPSENPAYAELDYLDHIVEEKDRETEDFFDFSDNIETEESVNG